MKDKIRDLREKYFMVDDEYLNGYARLCGIIATGVYLSLCRHVNKQQQCFPSKKLIAEELAVSEKSVYTALKELQKWNIISCEEQGRKDDGSYKVKLYTLWDKKHWVPKPQVNGTVGKKRQSPQVNDDTTRGYVVPNKETHINQTHIKDNADKSAGRLENEIIDLFKDINPLFQRLYSNKTQRTAAADLAKLGIDEVKKLVEKVKKCQGEKFFPSSDTPLKMANNINKIRSFEEEHKPVVINVGEYKNYG